MPANKSKNKINLLIREGFSETTGGRIIAWILSTFRITVILTELIVMAAFFSRFWLDAQNADLSDEIIEKQVVIATYSEFEKEFRETQKKLTIFSELTRDKGFIDKAIQTTTTSLPPDVFLKSLTFSPETISIEGFSPSEKSIQQLIVNLDSREIFENTSLEELGTSTSDANLFDFSIKIDLKQKET